MRWNKALNFAAWQVLPITLIGLAVSLLFGEFALFLCAYFVASMVSGLLLMPRAAPSGLHDEDGAGLVDLLCVLLALVAWVLLWTLLTSSEASRRLEINATEGDNFGLGLYA